MVTDIYRSTLVRDVLTRHAIRDADMFERVAAFAIDNVGNPFSARRVADFMKSQRRTIRHETVINYLAALAEAFVISRVPRYDIRGRALLATDEKHYVGDHGVVQRCSATPIGGSPGCWRTSSGLSCVAAVTRSPSGKWGRPRSTSSPGARKTRSTSRSPRRSLPQPRRGGASTRPWKPLPTTTPKYVLSLDPLCGRQERRHPPPKDSRLPAP